MALVRRVCVAGCGLGLGLAGVLPSCGQSSSPPGVVDARTAADAIVVDATADAAPDTAPPDSARDVVEASVDAGCGNLPALDPVSPASTQLTVAGDPGSAFGIYDPSLVNALDAGSGVLSYSTVAPNSVHTRVAASSDRGQTFQYLAELNVVTPGYIGMHTASSPDSWSPEQKLLGWSSNATISTSGVTQVLSSLPQLADCLAFTEPGAFVGSLGLDLALSCVYGTPPNLKIRVVLVRSTDHARTFSFVSTLLAAADAPCLGGMAPALQGADLFTAGGTEYLVISPIGAVANTDAGGYLGCVTIPFADPANGRLARDAHGAPSVVSWVQSSDGRFTGPCTFAEGATAVGQIVPMQFSDQSQPWFRILRTSIPEP